MEWINLERVNDNIYKTISQINKNIQKIIITIITTIMKVAYRIQFTLSKIWWWCIQECTIQLNGITTRMGIKCTTQFNNKKSTILLLEKLLIQTVNKIKLLKILKRKNMKRNLFRNNNNKSHKNRHNRLRYKK